MSSSWGNNIRISIFGESHGPAIGVVLDGLPAGEPVNMDALAALMSRRAPGRNRFSTQRRESDVPRILSGLHEGFTTGSPLCAIIENSDQHSKDYGDMKRLVRPGHADYTGYIRYSGYNDIRGGGHFSGRLTAPLVFAGALAIQILRRRGISVGGHIFSIGGVRDLPFDPVRLTGEQLEQVIAKPFPVLDNSAGEQMMAEIDEAREQQDSVGGVVECAAVGVPAGIGSPMFDGLENRIASLLFGIPAVKGVEFGAGFDAASMRGSICNDPFIIEEKDGSVKTLTNHHGGILGGISSGMPILLRSAFKPTPSIAHQQRTVNYDGTSQEILSVQGRHDPCIVLRAVPCVEACLALVILDSLLEGGNPNGFKNTQAAD